MNDLIHEKSILDIPMEDNDANAETIGEYLKTLLETLWAETDSFSGKRPFGNSGWDFELYNALCKNNLIEHDVNHYDDYIDYSPTPNGIKQGRELIYKAISEMYKR